MSMFSDYASMTDAMRGPGGLDMLGGTMPRPPDLTLGHRPESYNQHTIEGILGTRGRDGLSLERINKGWLINYLVYHLIEMTIYLFQIVLIHYNFHEERYLENY